MRGAASPMESPMPANEPWARIESHLRGRLRADLYDRWFAPLRPSRLEGDRLEVSAPDKFHRDFVDDNYRGFFEEFIPELLGRRVAISFVVEQQTRPSNGSSAEPVPLNTLA